MLIGRNSLAGRLLLNRGLLPLLVMPEAMGRAWLQHNIEEVGRFEGFLPALYNDWLDLGDTDANRIKAPRLDQVA